MPLKKGQKLVEHPKTSSLHLRLSEEEKQMIEDCAKKIGKNKTQTIIESVKKMMEETNE